VLVGQELAHLLKHVGPEDIAGADDLVDPVDLERELGEEPAFSVLVAGDIMLGGRARRVLAERGPDYPFCAVSPLLRRAHIVVGNLEGPLASRAARQERRFSYRVPPASAKSLARAGIRVVTLANNHLLDCGRAGVLETMAALEAAGVSFIGAGRNTTEAHRPAILEAAGIRVGLLGYYWNRRCAATHDRPGSAMDEANAMAEDIRQLRPRVDRIIVTCHWGVPYERQPSVEERAKARLAIELGADAVVGHHTHVVQPFEVYRDRPFFYGVGNFAFGSGNSRGEGLLVGLRFTPDATFVAAYPLYVKNRDPGVHYQPKVVRGGAARRTLGKLQASEGSGPRLRLESDRATVTLPYAPLAEPESW